MRRRRTRSSSFLNYGAQGCWCRRESRIWLSLAALAAVLLLPVGTVVAQPSTAVEGGSNASTPADEVAVTPEGAGGHPAGTIPTTSLFKVMQDGGLLMYPILLCSIISVVFLFERVIALRRGRVIPEPFVKRFLHQLKEGQLDREQALELCQKNGSPVAIVFAGAVRKWGRPGVEVEQALIDEGERVSTSLRRYLRVFHAVSTISPLLGLLGTVFGMISAFNSIATSKALGRPELLATGISEALLTTAFGLAVAIPALIFYWLFVSVVDRRIVEIDALGQELVNQISGDSGAELPVAKAAKSRRREMPAEAGRP